MCTIARIAQDVTMATMQLMQVAWKQAGWTRLEEARMEFRPPRMNWVVVADEKQNRRMRMCWAPSVDTR